MYIDISTVSTQVERILLQQTSRDLLASTALAALPPMQDLVFIGQSPVSNIAYIKILTLACYRNAPAGRDQPIRGEAGRGSDQ